VQALARIIEEQIDACAHGQLLPTSVQSLPGNSGAE